MNQRIAVRAIIREGDKTLLLRRGTGRDTILGKFELPGGKLEYGEQPEDSLSRYMQQEMGAVMAHAQLYDVLTYVDHDDRDMQYVIILYIASLRAGYRLDLSQNYDRYLWKELSEIHQPELTESTKLLLGISQQSVQKDEHTEFVLADVKRSTDADTRLIIYSDGGSRGNPGPSASGFVIMDADEQVIHEGGVYLGITTNNQAEYHGVRLGLEKALEMKAKTIDFRLDSLLVVNQLKGVYQIKNRELWPIHDRIKDLLKNFEKVTFMHVKREFNQLADGMVNKILNAHTDK